MNRLLFLVSCTLAVSMPARADDPGFKIDNLGSTYLTEGGDYRALIVDRCNLALVLDRPYAILGFKLTGSQGYAAYVLSPRDGNSSANLLLGQPPQPRSDEDVSRSPGFTRITRRKVTVNGLTVEWREWGDAEHLQSDALVDFPVCNGQPAQTQKVFLGIVANSEARRHALEDHLLQTTVLNPDLRTLSAPLVGALRQLHIDYSRWRVLNVTANEVKWLDDHGDEVGVRVDPRTSISVPLDDEAALRRFWREEAKRRHGGMVAADIHVAKGRPDHYVTMIAKYPLPSIAGWAYQGVALVPRDGDVIQLDIRSRETGITGMREAAAVLAAAAQTSPKLNVEKAAKEFTKDPYDPKFDAEAKYSLSDDPKYDAAFRDHPLSKCRAALAACLTGLTP